jgi:hypothetical protein
MASAIGIAIVAATAPIFAYLYIFAYFWTFIFQQPWFQVSDAKLLGLWWWLFEIVYSQSL